MVEGWNRASVDCAKLVGGEGDGGAEAVRGAHKEGCAIRRPKGGN